jgi:hypothetical protein
MKELIEIQKELKAPKNQKNNFGNYKYRSCEDILEAVKPLCIKHNCLLTISDEIVMLGDRFYVKATATFSAHDLLPISVSAYAREAQTKKGMDESQITGSASSYARKYALNGLFCIDDTKDADTMDNTHKAPEKPVQKFEDYKPATANQREAFKQFMSEFVKTNDTTAIKHLSEHMENSKLSEAKATELITSMTTYLKNKDK